MKIHNLTTGIVDYSKYSINLLLLNTNFSALEFSFSIVLTSSDNKHCCLENTKYFVRWKSQHVEAFAAGKRCLHYTGVLL